MEGRRSMVVLGAVWMVLAVSCAIITVNIYFPEKAVQEAYRELEKELMTPEGKPREGGPKEAPEGKPESTLRFEFVRAAFAQEPGMSEQITGIIKKMPDVVNAYREMGARIAETERLRDSGAVGEGNDGMLVLREGALSPADRKIVEQENENRRTVIFGMTRAIVRINRVPETPQNIDQVKPQATAQFAKLRHDSAKKGWWVQNPNGNWVKK